VCVGCFLFGSNHGLGLCFCVGFFNLWLDLCGGQFGGYGSMVVLVSLGSTLVVSLGSTIKRAVSRALVKTTLGSMFFWFCYDGCMDFLRGEPVVAGVAGLDVVVISGLSLAVSLGWVELSGDQLAGVAAFVVALSGVVAGLVRRRVTPESTFEPRLTHMFDEGFEEGIVHASSGILDDIFGAGDGFAEGS